MGVKKEGHTETEAMRLCAAQKKPELNSSSLNHGLTKIIILLFLGKKISFTIDGTGRTCPYFYIFIFLIFRYIILALSNLRLHPRVWYFVIMLTVYPQSLQSIKCRLADI